MNGLNLPAGDSLSDRAVSGFPLSIGTAIALESIFAPRQQPYDPARPVPVHINVSKYQEIWINIHTLFRNLVGAASKQAFLRAKDHEIKEVLEMEMDVIESLFATEGNGFCKPVFYFCTYAALYDGKVSRFVKVRQDKTEYQKFYTSKLMTAMKLLKHDRNDVKLLDSELKTQQKKNALILTHVPYDLVSYSNFLKLDLIESHTGVLKSKQKWNTKYFPVGDADLTHLPFHRKLLLVFGDKVLIQPMDIRLRRQIVDIAEKRHWNQTTTISKIDLDLSLDIKEPFVLETLRSL